MSTEEEKEEIEEIILQEPLDSSNKPLNTSESQEPKDEQDSQKTSETFQEDSELGTENMNDYDKMSNKEKEKYGL